MNQKSFIDFTKYGAGAGNIIDKHEDKIFKELNKNFFNRFAGYANKNIRLIAPAPTELVEIEVNSGFMDTTFLNEMGDYDIFEFQSTDIRFDDELRFGGYMWRLHRQTKRHVELYIFSTVALENYDIHHKINEENELTMHVISFKEIDSEKVLNRIKKKIANNDEADDDDIVDVVLLPFMGSKRSLTELVEISVNLANELIVDNHLREEIKSIQLVLVDKFIEDPDKQDELIGVIGLTNKLLKRYVEKHEKIAREEEKERWINVLIENDVADEDISRSSGLSIDEILHYKKIAQKKF